MQSDLESLVNELRNAVPGSLIFEVAVYARRDTAGLLAEQGALLGALADGVLAKTAAAISYRVLWSQLVFIVPADSALSAKEAVLETAAALSNQTIEIRGAWCVVDGGRTPDWLDDFLGELSLRRNFGTCLSVQGRMVDGKEVQPKDVPEEP